MNTTTTQFITHPVYGWQQELNKLSAKYLVIGTTIAVILNPVFGIVDYLTMTNEWQHFMMIRICVTLILSAFLVKRSFIHQHPQVAGFLILLSVTSQDAYIYSKATPDIIESLSLSYMADFVGASMVLLWSPVLAIIFILLFVAINLVFLLQNSAMPPNEFLSSGGLLVLAGALFGMVMIVFRYQSVKSMIVSKMELVRNNEWMAVQNEIIEEKSAALQQSNNRLKEFAYIVSHDLKAPLRGVRNIASWIREDCGNSLNEHGVTHLKLMEKQILKMENLIRAVLEYSKTGISKNNSEWINIDEMIKDVIEMVEVDNRTQFSLKTELVQIKGIRIVISQVLQNLLSNSVKHNDKTLKVVDIEVREEEEQFYFLVADNGPGIDPRDHNKIFDLFQTLRNTTDYESSGIGLPVAKKMIEEAGGKLWLDSTPGNGSKFQFTIPKS
ncbi:MAG: ATP-binding protein [Bacteroidota bacterium]|nr:ATP-binding protein [Bacteroidota bacterium]